MTTVFAPNSSVVVNTKVVGGADCTMHERINHIKYQLSKLLSKPTPIVLTVLVEPIGPCCPSVVVVAADEARVVIGIVSTGSPLTSVSITSMTV